MAFERKKGCFGVEDDMIPMMVGLYFFSGDTTVMKSYISYNSIEAPSFVVSVSGTFLSKTETTTVTVDRDDLIKIATELAKIGVDNSLAIQDHIEAGLLAYTALRPLSVRSQLVVRS